MSELPSTWAKVKIGDLCDLINGRAFKPTDWTATGLPIVRIQNLNNPHAPFNYFDGEVRDRFLIAHGDLLFAWSGTPGTSFGAHVWTGGRAVLNQHIFNVLYASETLDRDFFRLAINQKLEELIDKAHGGVGLRHVTKGRFEETEVEFPPLPEQRRIVSKLDSLFARTKTARDELARIPTLIEHYKQAILKKAFSGELTADWRASNTNITTTDSFLEKIKLTRKECWTNDEERKRVTAKKYNLSVRANSTYRPPEHASNDTNFPVLPEGWRWVTVDELAWKVVDGIHKKPNYVAEGIPFVTVRNLTAGDGINLENVNYVSRDDHIHFCLRANPERGDILISKDGTLGVIRAINRDLEFSIFVSVALVKPVAREMSRYLELAFRSPQVQNQMIGVGSGLQHIHLIDLRKDCIPVAPPEEQIEIVLRIEKAMKWLRVVEAEAHRAAYLVEPLDQGILTKAFRGELVPQDPNDEPAEKLLERIRAGRAVQPRERRGRGRQRKAG